MAQRQLGKLCLSIPFESICQFRPSTALSAHLRPWPFQISDYSQGRHAYQRKLRLTFNDIQKALSTGYNIHSIIRSNEYSWTTEWDSPEGLFPDVFPFFDSVQQEPWPFSETIIYILATDPWQLQYLKELDVPLDRPLSPLVQTRGISLPIMEKVEPRKKMLAILRTMKKDLYGSQSSHRTFRFITVTNSLGDSIATLRFLRSPAAFLERPRSSTRSVSAKADAISFDSYDTTPEISPNVRSLRRLENLPQITSLTALTNWKRDYFRCVNFRPQGHVLDLLKPAKKSEEEI